MFEFRHSFRCSGSSRNGIIYLWLICTQLKKNLQIIYAHGEYPHPYFLYPDTSNQIKVSS